MKQRLQDLRHDHDLSQKQLAKILNMSQSGYSKYETGENHVPVYALIRLATLYDTSIDFLLGMTNEKRSYKRTETQEILYREYQNRLQAYLEQKGIISHS